MLSITDLKKNTVFEFDNQPYRVVDYKQKVMGRGGSIVNVRIKSLLDGKVLDKTFKGSDQFSSADIDSISAQYLYESANSYFFMDPKSFEQFEVDKLIVSSLADYFKEGDNLNLQQYKGKVINVDLPKNVPLKVSYTEAAVKGDTSTSITKEAELETGLKIKVPAFIKVGDTISVDTENGSYRERIKT